MTRYCLLSLMMVATEVAGADTLRASRGQKLIEKSHAVQIKVKNGLATYRVRRTFHNYGKRAEEALLEINLPHGAVATGLRIKAKTRWYDGELMHRDKAEQLYRELTGLGPSEPKDPALLYWRWTDELRLRLFPIFPGKSSVVEYTLTVPTEYEDGKYYLSYGRKPKAKNLATPHVRILHGSEVAEISLDGKKSKSAMKLAPLTLHPVLKANKIDNPRVLVMPLVVGDTATSKKVVVSVNAKHTWPGDLELNLVDARGKLHNLLQHDFSRDENDMKASFTVPYGFDAKGTWHLLVEDHHPLDGGQIKNWSIEVEDAKRTFVSRVPAFIPQPSGSRSDVATIGLAKRKPNQTRVRLGRVALVRKHQFARLEIDVAKQLSRLPRRQAVVFVIDRSHTFDEEGIAAQLRLARAYLSHVPDAQFSIIGVARHAKPLTSGFVPAIDFAQTVKKLQAKGELRPRNGSFLDRGIALAAKQVQSQTRQAAVILMTDDRLRTAWKTNHAKQITSRLPKNATVHVADIFTGTADLKLTRDDSHRLFAIAKTRGGVALEVAGAGEGKFSQLANEALYLVRPNRVDHVRLTGGLSAKVVLADSDNKDVLREGQSVRWQDEIKTAPRRATVRGQLWSRKVVYRGQDSEPLNRATAGFVFSHDQYSGLSDAEQFVIATYGKAVSPVTSYLAIEPGVRPSTIGFEDLGSFGLGLAGVGGGGGGKVYGMLSQPFSWTTIKERIRRQCGQVGVKDVVTLAIETNDREIADINIEGGVSDVAKCMREAMWLEDLPAHQTFSGDRWHSVSINAEKRASK